MSEHRKISRLFDVSGNLTRGAMLDYIAGRLTTQEKRMVELHLAESDFEREALEGLKMMDMDRGAMSIEEIRGNVRERFAKSTAASGLKVPVSANAVGRWPFGGRLEQRWGIGQGIWMPVAVAAALLALLAVVYFAFLYQRGPKKPLHFSETIIQSQDSMESIRQLSRENIGAVQSKSDSLQYAAGDQRSYEAEKGARQKSGEKGRIVTNDQFAAANQSKEKSTSDSMQVTITGPQPSVSGKTMPVVAGVKAPGTEQKVLSMTAHSLAESQVQAATVISDHSAEFPGGDSALEVYIAKNLRYPDGAREKKTGGVVLISFMVNEEGRLSEIDILKGLGEGYDEEALKLIRNMPPWQPAIRAGQAIPEKRTIEITFQ
jgi:TonB family protein